ncbi:MAG: serine--tRNA ligase, partial [Candidatus Acidiferrales bacterium]
MIDLNYFREHLDEIERMLQNRNARLDLDAFRTLDAERRRRITSVERLKAERNTGSKEFASLGLGAGLAAGNPEAQKQQREKEQVLRARMKEIADKIKEEDVEVAQLDEKLRDFMLSVPNIPHSSVPVGRGAEGNVEVRRWGAPPKFDFAPKPHWELGEAAGILDLERAVKIAGARFALYRGAGARLERALANFFLDVHTREQGYTEVLPPFIVNTASLIADGKLPKFAGDMFHLENTDLWLTTTAETELTNLYRDETLDDALLPIKVCAWTACFRSEAGAAGKDTRGIKRQHQFQKVEMFKFTRPEESYDELEKMVRDAEVLLQQLGLHYRVMQLCTGDMGFASSKTYDIEVWVPSAKEFMEISSCSNCEAFQARRAGIRYKPAVAGKSKPAPKNQKSEFVHTLN